MKNPTLDCTDSCDILTDTVNNAEVMIGAHIRDQEYYNQQDQQYSFYNSNIGSTQVELELAPEIIEEDGLCKFMNQYDKLDNTPYSSVFCCDIQSSHTFTSHNKYKSRKKSIKLEFCISESQS